MTAILVPVSICEEKLQPHDEGKTASLLAVDHAGKPVEAALQGPHVNALVGRPLLLRQNGRSVKTHVASGRDLVRNQIQADQRYGYLQGRASLGTA